MLARNESGNSMGSASKVPIASLDSIKRYGGVANFTNLSTSACSADGSRGLFRLTLDLDGGIA